MATGMMLSILAGAGTTAGALMLFVQKNWNRKYLGFYLGLAAGVMVAVVLFDMMPMALLAWDWRQVLGGLAIGLLLLQLFKPLLQGGDNGNGLVGLGYLIMLGIALHDLPEGMAIALGSEVKAKAGFIIAMAIGLHNIPEGMAIAAPLIMGGLSRFNVFKKTLWVGIITPVGTICGYLALAILPGLLPLLLGLASGIMINLVWTQLWPQASAQDNVGKWWGFGLGLIIIILATFA